MKKRILIITLVASMVFTFAGCNNKKSDVHEVNKDVTNLAKDYAQQIDESKQEIEALDEASGITKLTVCYINLLNVDIGMICMIDPVTMQQINVDALPAEQLISTEVNVPTENKEIKWAIYNKNGELYSESTTDVSNAKSSVWIILKGDKTIDGIDTLFDPTEEEVKEAIKQ